jgi:spore maturation protein CgeB
VRLFEAAACGTPIISDYWRGLDELLPDGNAIIIAHDTEDVVEALSGTTSSQREEIATNARSRVLEGHTGLARSRQLVTALEDLQSQARVEQPARQRISA